MARRSTSKTGGTLGGTSGRPRATAPGPKSSDASEKAPIEDAVVVPDDDGNVGGGSTPQGSGGAPEDAEATEGMGLARSGASASEGGGGDGPSTGDRAPSRASPSAKAERGGPQGNKSEAVEGPKPTTVLGSDATAGDAAGRVGPTASPAGPPSATSSSSSAAMASGATAVSAAGRSTMDAQKSETRARADGDVSDAAMAQGPVDANSTGAAPGGRAGATDRSTVTAMAETPRSAGCNGASDQSEWARFCAFGPRRACGGRDWIRDPCVHSKR